MTRRRHLRPGEERQVGAGMPLGIGVEEVIGAGIVLVDALLHQPHAEHARIEVEVLLRGARDGRDVVQAVDASHLVEYSGARRRPKPTPNSATPNLESRFLEVGSLFVGS